MHSPFSSEDVSRYCTDCCCYQHMYCSACEHENILCDLTHGPSQIHAWIHTNHPTSRASTLMKN